MRYKLEALLNLSCLLFNFHNGQLIEVLPTLLSLVAGWSALNKNKAEVREYFLDSANSAFKELKYFLGSTGSVSIKKNLILIQ